MMTANVDTLWCDIGHWMPYEDWGLFDLTTYGAYMCVTMYLYSMLLKLRARPHEVTNHAADAYIMKW